jgi:hypothetical protein
MRTGWALLAAMGVVASCGRENATADRRSLAKSIDHGSAGLGGHSDGATRNDAGGGMPNAGEGGQAAGDASGGRPSAGGAGSPASESAGESATGGAGAGGATGGEGGAEPRGPCGFRVSTTLSPTIATVGIVNWSVNLPSIDQAQIEFGLDRSYGTSAPVDLNAERHRTLLLGMKPSHAYHFRIVATGGDERCQSPDYTLTTGPLPDGLPAVTLDEPLRSAAAGGFIVTCGFTDGPAFIIDADGDYVWWFGSGQLGRASMSYDGNYMWYRNVNVPGGRSVVRRVGMDGLGDQSFPEFGDSHHDLTVLPDETVGFIERDGTCDRIMERAPDGSVRAIIDVHDAHGGTTMCHTNSIHYHAEDDSYTFSDLNQNTYVKVTRAGKVVWVLGGSTSQFSGDGSSWTREHGHQLLDATHLLFFNNGAGDDPSAAVEVALDFDALTATRVWEYDGDLKSSVYGDVQRLDNGNTLVTYSTAGVIQEVNPSGKLVREFAFAASGPLGGALGYATLRRSLYGAPPE